MSPLFAWVPGPMELIILLIIGVLFFGRRLPEVGRSLGKGIVEFKKGMKGLEDDLDMGGPAPMPQHMSQPQVPSEQIRPPQRVTATAPKFEDNLPNISTPPRQ